MARQRPTSRSLSSRLHDPLPLGRRRRSRVRTSPAWSTSLAANTSMNDTSEARSFRPSAAGQLHRLVSGRGVLSLVQEAPAHVERVDLDGAGARGEATLPLGSRPPVLRSDCGRPGRQRRRPRYARQRDRENLDRIYSKPQVEPPAARIKLGERPGVLFHGPGTGRLGRASDMQRRARGRSARLAGEQQDLVGRMGPGRCPCPVEDAGEVVGSGP